MKLLVAVLLAVLAFPLAGCSISTDDHAEKAPERPAQEADYSGELEAQIRQQLPAEAKRLTGSSGFVSNVGCVHSVGSTYECLATISGPNAYGEYVTEQVPIEGTCDEAQCIWKASP